MLDILPHHFSRDIFIQPFIDFHHARQIFPATWCCKLSAVNRRFHLIKAVTAKFQISQNRRMDIFFVSIFFPDPVIWLHHNLLHTVKCYDIKIAHGLVVFRRVSCRYDHPAFRNLMISESFALQELKHCRCQCL